MRVLMNIGKMDGEQLRNYIEKVAELHLRKRQTDN